MNEFHSMPYLLPASRRAHRSDADHGWELAAFPNYAARNVPIDLPADGPGPPLRRDGSGFPDEHHVALVGEITWRQVGGPREVLFDLWERPDPVALRLDVHRVTSIDKTGIALLTGR